MGVSDTSTEQKLQRLWEEQGENVGVPQGVRDLLNAAFSKTPVSSFPKLPCGKVLEISGDASISDAVHLLAENSNFSAPVNDAHANSRDPWSVQYIGIIDYASILWVLEQAELAAAAIATGSAAAAGIGAGALGALGALVLGLTGPFAIAGVTIVAVGVAIAGGAAAERGVMDASSAVYSLGEDFYKVILENELFKCTKVKEITRSYRWAPFLPVQLDDSMLTVLLLLIKCRLRSIPVISIAQGVVQTMISQSSVTKGLSQCPGRDWFDSIARKPIQQLGLPVMTPEQVVSVDASKLVLEAFKLMKEKGVGGLPVVAGPDHHIVGSLSVRDVRFLLLKSHLFASCSHLTVLEFMKTISNVEAQTGTIPPVTCEKLDPLGKVIEMLASKNLYRIYVVDETTRLLGVITLRDIIGCFVSEPPGFFDAYFGGAFKTSFEELGSKFASV